MILNYERCELDKCFPCLYETSITTPWFATNVQHIIHSYVDVTYIRVEYSPIYPYRIPIVVIVDGSTD